MKKNKVLRLCIVMILILIGIGGTKKVVTMNYEAQKERQIEFLKKNKATIIDKAFTVDGKLAVKDIQFDWETVQVEYAGIIKANPYAVSVKVTSTQRSDGKRYTDVMIVKTDVEKLDSVTDVAFR